MATNKPLRFLCKRTQTNGDDYQIQFYRVVPRDNRMLVAGVWYYVVYNENDSEQTFSILDHMGNRHLFYMYGEENDQNYNLSRTYAKWVYTPNEFSKHRQRRITRLL